jgi:hypothetical protein
MNSLNKLFIICLATAILTFASSQSLFSQYAVCTPDPATTDPEGVGVRTPHDLPVAFIGDYYNTVLTIIAPAVATTWGFIDFHITKIQLTEMTNMPGGMNWETNSGNADDFMYGGEKYCMIVDGTPSGTPGIRKIDVYANAWIRVIFETQAPGNPRNGGDVTFTLCNSLNLELGNNLNITTDDVRTISADQQDDYHTYLWQDNSTAPVFEIDGEELGIGTHKIKVTVTDTVGTTGIYSDRVPCCFKSDSIMVTVTQGNAGISVKKNDSFSVFPNPSDGKFFISLTNFTTNIPIEISDINGAIVYVGNLSKKETELDLSFLSKGAYFVALKDNYKTKQKKIVIY